MGLSDAIARQAARHARALLVEVPGEWRTRAAAEQGLRAREWRTALSPADADLLVVCGEPGRALSEAVEVVWHQLPGPRVRVDLRPGDDVASRLDEAYAALLDGSRHRADARSRPSASDLLEEGAGHEDMDHGDMDHGDMDHGDGSEGDTDHGDGSEGDMDHGDGSEGDMDHGDMDHGDHGDMEMSPGGIPLAEGGEDRDGLEMDVLEVRLGPVLPHWPAGLVLHCSLQGDVIASARGELLDGVPTAADDAPQARRLDHLASLLALAGWDDAAARARGVRDAVLAGSDPGPARTRLDRQVRRSRLLRWSLRGVAPLGPDAADGHGLPEEAIGDAHDRLLRLLDAAGEPAAAGTGTYGVDQLALLVTGLDLATARLAIAGLDLQAVRPAEPDHDEEEAHHG